VPGTLVMGFLESPPTVAFRAPQEKPSPDDVARARRELALTSTLRHAVWLSRRCTEEYRRSVDPRMHKTSASHELVRRLRDQGRFSVHPPSWLAAQRPDDLGYVMVGEEIALPIRFDLHGRARFTATNCFVREDSIP
jgi:hypothetical protein